MDYSKQVFELLGVQPYEEFKIREGSFTYPDNYRLTHSLVLEVYWRECWRKSCKNVGELLSETYEMIKKENIYGIR
jgi:hypothetical protein